MIGKTLKQWIQLKPIDELSICEAAKPYRKLTAIQLTGTGKTLEHHPAVNKSFKMSKFIAFL